MSKCCIFIIAYLCTTISVFGQKFALMSKVDSVEIRVFRDGQLIHHHFLNDGDKLEIEYGNDGSLLIQWNMKKCKCTNLNAQYHPVYGPTYRIRYTGWSEEYIYRKFIKWVSWRFIPPPCPLKLPSTHKQV